MTEGYNPLQGIAKGYPLSRRVHNEGTLCHTFKRRKRVVQRVQQGSPNSHHTLFNKRTLTIGRINTELTVITIDETSIAYVRVNREHLENEIFLDENYSAIPVERHVSESAKRILDENLVTNSKEIVNGKKQQKNKNEFMPGIRVRRNSPKNL